MTNHSGEAIAEVTSCTYNAGVGRAMAFGLPTTRRFRITFNYRVGDELHTGELASEKPMPQGMLFPVRYDPTAPHLHEHDQRGGEDTVRRAQIVLGVAGSVILSLLWWLLLHNRH